MVREDQVRSAVAVHIDDGRARWALPPTAAAAGRRPAVPRQPAASIGPRRSPGSRHRRYRSFRSGRGHSRDRRRRRRTGSGWADRRMGRRSPHRWTRRYSGRKSNTGRGRRRCRSFRSGPGWSRRRLHCTRAQAGRTLRSDPRCRFRWNSRRPSRTARRSSIRWLIRIPNRMPNRIRIPNRRCRSRRCWSWSRCTDNSRRPRSGSSPGCRRRPRRHLRRSRS